MSLTQKERRQLRTLQEDGYLSRDNPMTSRILALLEKAPDPRPLWFRMFLESENVEIAMELIAERYAEVFVKLASSD